MALVTDAAVGEALADSLQCPHRIQTDMPFVLRLCTLPEETADNGIVHMIYRRSWRFLAAEAAAAHYHMRTTAKLPDWPFIAQNAIHVGDG